MFRETAEIDDRSGLAFGSSAGEFFDVDAVFDQGEAARRVVFEQVEIEALYKGYLPRQLSEAKQLRAQDAVPLPDKLDYGRIGGLSNEMRERLEAAQPATFGALTRIPGISPPAIVAVLGHARMVQAQRFT